MRILHLSDFHLNKTTRADWNDHVKDSLIQKIKELNTTERIDIIAFTGDLIDKGGKELGGADDAFKIFKEEIILPLLEAAGIGIDRFFITPGNHDIVRDLDTLRDELGSREYFTKHQNISSFILEALSKNIYDGFQRIVPYKAFEKDLYQSVPNYSHSIFESSFKLDIHGAKIGISCINSSWRCYDDEDYGRILIGEK